MTAIPPAELLGLTKAATHRVCLPLYAFVTALISVAHYVETIEMMESTLPVRPPYSQAGYSSLAFTLISLALSEKEGKTYDDLLDEMIITPLGLSNTGVSPGDSAKAVIPPLSDEEQGWGADYGLSAP